MEDDQKDIEEFVEAADEINQSIISTVSETKKIQN
jgi:hypothetical protein